MDAPPADKFLYRAFTSVAALGDYLYIEGGEIKIAGDEVISRPVNSTLSLPLKSSWKSSSAPLNIINKGSAPTVKQPALWPSPDGKTIYSWGGEGPWADEAGAKNRSLWAFTPDSFGGGTWGVQQPASANSFAAIHRTGRALYTSCGQIGLSVSGFGVANTDEFFPDPRKEIPVSGLITYEMDSRTWSNKTAVPALQPQYGWLWGAGTCMPPRNKTDHLAFFLGGAKTSSTSINFPTLADFSNVTFYDPKADRWYWQTTTGTAPRGRTLHCAVGVSGKNDTYEIFVYGGTNTAVNSIDAYNDLFILTIPGFHWTQANVISPPRQLHSCAHAGNSQMIVVGGWESAAFNWPPGPDQWPLGIGVFNMKQLSWRDSYDANAADYDTPDDIQRWYAGGGLKSVEWSSNAVKGLFVQGIPSSSNTPKEQKSSSTGTIVGGTIGGVALLALIGLFYFLWKRRKAAAKASPTKEREYESPHYPGLELPGDGYYASKEYGNVSNTPQEHDSAWNMDRGAKYPMREPQELETQYHRAELA